MKELKLMIPHEFIDNFKSAIKQTKFKVREKPSLDEGTYKCVLVSKRLKYKHFSADQIFKLGSLYGTNLITADILKEKI